MVLDGHVRVKADGDPPRCPFGLRQAGGVVVEPAGAEFADLVTVHLFAVTEAAVHPGTRLGSFEEGLGQEFVPSLVGPPLARRSSLGGRILELAAEEGFNLRFPRVLVHGV